MTGDDDGPRSRGVRPPGLASSFVVADDDGPNRSRRVLRVVRRGEVLEPPKRSTNAAAAQRYRARQRGEDVPKKKPGPKPSTITDLRQQLRDRDRRIAELDNLLRIATERLARQRQHLTLPGVAGEMLTVLRRTDPRYDLPEVRVLLCDLVVEIEDRHKHWLE